jgi:hypothetical protein
VQPQTTSLPPVFAEWMAALLPGPIPEERAATCDRCAMLRPDGPATATTSSYFGATTKCCTYLPELANFLVGRVLADTSAEGAFGRTTVEARIDRRIGVSPLGLRKTPVFSLLYRTSPASFGHAPSMRCPHYIAEGGRCGVWRHRESTCATWFCKYVRGGTGQVFWQRLHDVLAAGEEVVSMACLAEVGLDARALAALNPTRAAASAAARAASLSAADVEGEVDDAAYDAAWGAWAGRERELYLRCAAIAGGLRWADVVRHGGVRLELLCRLLLDAYAKLVAVDVPERVERRHLRILYSSPDSAEVIGYSGFDPLRVPRRLVEVLHHFDGRPTREALDAIAGEHDLRLSDGLVRKLVDFGVLAESKKTSPYSRGSD